MPIIKSESQWMTCSEKLSEIYKPKENKINKEDKKEHIRTKRQFVEIIVKHPNPNIYKYKEYNIKPYYEIKYIENGEEVVGYGTYSPKMLSKYLKDFFMPSELSEQKNGKWIPILSYNNTYKCSECGRLLTNITNGKNSVIKDYPYCHCGAKMEVWEMMLIDINGLLKRFN